MENLNLSEVQPYDYYKDTSRVSNSMLGWLKVSPAYFLNKLRKNNEEAESKAFENGKLLHAYLEHKANFVVADITKPSGKLGLVMDAYYYQKDILKKSEEDAWQIAYKTADYGKGYSLDRVKTEFAKAGDYYTFLQEASGKYVLTKEQQYLINGGIHALKNNPLASEVLDLHGNNLFEESYNELEILWDYELITGEVVPAKSRLDHVSIDHGRECIIVNDLKSTSSSPYGTIISVPGLSTGNVFIDFRTSGWMSKYLTFGYFRQKEMYIQAIQNCPLFEKYSHYKIEFNFVVVQLGDAFDVVVYNWEHGSYTSGINHGALEIEQLMSIYHRIFIENIQVPQEKERLIV